jgi:hypothetical protein
MGEIAMRWYMRIGTWTPPGPCATQVAVGVRDGAGLGVIVGVSLGAAVKLGVIGTDVPVCVGVLAVQAALRQPHKRAGISRKM